jgi:hypothetical protein
MALKRRIFVSLPSDDALSSESNEIKWAIVSRIEHAAPGYTAEIFFNPSRFPGRPGTLALGRDWSMHAVDAVMRSCIGAVVIGLPRWRAHQFKGKPRAAPSRPPASILASEVCYYEGAVAASHKLPTLVIIGYDVERRFLFSDAESKFRAIVPKGANSRWLSTYEFKIPFDNWKCALESKRDVFLGYCSSSANVAHQLKSLLTTDLGLNVLDWQTGFAPARSILHQIEDAASRCSTGLFLFTRDDPLSESTVADTAVPRDNVILEAGYFIALKGKHRVLVVREVGAKMPADLGGDIFLQLDDRNDLSKLRAGLEKFFAAMDTTIA